MKLIMELYYDNNIIYLIKEWQHFKRGLREKHR